MKPELVTTSRAAEILGGLKPNTLENWRVRGVGPRYLKIGGLVRYSTADLDAYLETQKRQSTSQVTA